MRALLALVVLLGMVAQTTRADDRAALSFRRLLINVGGERSEACFRFDGALATDAPDRYAEHLRIEPTLRPALRIEKNDLCVGNLAFGTRYRVTLLAGLPGQGARRLRQDVAMTVGLGDRPSTIAIAGEGFILPRATAHGLTVSTVNVSRVRLHVFRISTVATTERISTALGGSKIDLAETRIESFEFSSLLASALTPVWQGEMDIARQPNRTVDTAFPIASVIGASRPGLFLVVAEDASRSVPASTFDPARAGDDEADLERWPGGGLAAHWVDVTNIGLTSFSGADGVHVFARALDTALPMPGVRLVLRAEGQDELAEAMTDAAGGAAFGAGVARGRSAQAPAAIEATGPGNDYTVERLDGAAFDFSDRGADGAKPPGPAQAVLASDRGVYRPGETVNLTALLRDAGGTAIGDERLTLVLRRPDGVEARRVTVGASADGGWAVAMPLTESAALGQWRVEALNDPTAPPIGSVAFSVQDFVPQLLAVTLHPATTTVAAGAPVQARLDGRFLYGAPAAGLGGQGELRIERDPDPVPGFGGYAWGLAGETVDVPPATIAIDAAGEDGSAKVSATPAISPGLTSPLRAVLRAGLFEPGGRIVEDTVTLPMLGTRPLIGLRALGGAGTGDEEAAPILVATAGADRRPAALHGLRWSVIRENRIYDWFETDGDWTFHYHVVDEPVANGTLDTGADGRGRIAPVLDWGSYRVVVSDEASGATSSARFDVGWDSADSGPDAPDRIPVTVRDATLAPGARTVLHIAAPFAGHALLLIGGTRVFETRLIDVPRGGLDVPVTADAAWGVGAYATVTLYRPLDAPARPHDPVRAVGLAWIGIDARARTLAVSMAPPAIVVPRRTLSVPVRVAGGTPGETVRLTLAAVDEGILQLTRYRLPDPAVALFGKRALGLDMRDEYGRLLDGGAPAGVIRSGGDEGAGGAGLPVVSSKVVSLFAGPVTLDASGRATVALDVPDFEGQLRLMATAWSVHAVGSASTDVTVRDPVFADVALPRFLAPGDAARIAVSVADTDAPGGMFHVKLQTTGAVRIAGTATFDATLARGGRQQFAAMLEAVEAGVGTVSATLARADAPDAAALWRTWSIAVRPAHAPETTAVTAEQRPGESWQPDPWVLTAYEPGSGSIAIGYDGFAGIDTVGLLQSLDDDNWNCSEQLASSSWPLLYFNDAALLGRMRPPDGVRARVQGAVDAILDREDAAGRFGLWRVGDGAATPWLDVYVLDFLQHAKEEGFTVPDAALGRALDWLDEEQVQGFGDFDADQRLVPQTRAYALYVLARGGRASPDAIRRMHDDAYVQTDDAATRLVFWNSDADAASLAQPSSLAHLGAGLALTGDDGAAADTFDMAIDNLGSVRTGRAGWFDFTYWSYVRDLADVATLAAEAGDAKRANDLIGRFGQLTLTPPLLDDTEKAALLGAAHALDRNAPGRQLSLNGVATAPVLHLPAAFSPDMAALGKPYVLANTGRMPLWRTVTVVGVPRGPVLATARGFTLERQIFDLDGNAVDPAHLRQNDRIVVVLHGTVADDDDHRAILVDALPAAIEIESPVHTPDEYSFIGAITRPRSVEARDDRFVAAFDLGADLDPPQFTEENDSDTDNSGDSTDNGGNDSDKSDKLAANEFRVAYVARVVTPGHFTVPEAIVRDMYRPTESARTASGVTDVTPAH